MMIFNDGESVKRFVLIVEDELINREILGAMLEDDYHILYAVNGVEALETLKENGSMVSVVLLDLMMPEMNGFEVIEAMKQDGQLRHIPIIVLTSEEDAEVKTLNLGASDFIKKPYNYPDVIKARIARTIEFSEDRYFIESNERDQLTGLYNKTFFYKYAEMIDKYHPDLRTDAVILNVEHFHLVNEIYGRSFGDRVLVTIADSIREFISGSEGLAGRSEADSFFIYISHNASYDGLTELIRTRLADLSRTLHIRIRIGVYPKVEHELPMEERFSDARFACNTLRGNYLRSIAYYDMSLREHSIFEEHMISDIHEGLEKEQFIVVYQPKYDVSGSDPLLCGIEAYVRWNHPTYGMIRPKSFLSVFEQNGLIHLLDHYVIGKAIRQLAAWHKEINLSVPMSVNISRINLYDSDFADFLRGNLSECGLTSADLILEITESAYSSDTRQLIDAVERLRRIGFKIEMDDFGSGYSSLTSLTSMPIDVLGLDAGFVTSIHEDDKIHRLVNLIKDIADYMGVPVNAEGVELATQYDLLKEIGCRYMQGYYFTKPLPADEFRIYLEDMC